MTMKHRGKTPKSLTKWDDGGMMCGADLGPALSPVDNHALNLFDLFSFPS
jgi:hypothetical protein